MAFVSLLNGENDFRYYCHFFNLMHGESLKMSIKIINEEKESENLLCRSRVPESLPCLHDKVLAAAADAAFSFSSNQNKKQVHGKISFLVFISEETNLLIQFIKLLQGAAPGILRGIAKGFKGGK